MLAMIQPNAIESFLYRKAKNKERFSNVANYFPPIISKSIILNICPVDYCLYLLAFNLKAISYFHSSQ